MTLNGPEDQPSGAAPATTSGSSEPARSDAQARAAWRRLGAPCLIFALTAATYAGVAGPRVTGPSPNNHFVVLADAWLDGRLGLEGHPPGYNDWACFDESLSGPCAADALQHDREGYRWHISFPPLPAVVLLPAVAIFGQDFSDPLFWALFAGLAPAFLYSLLRRLSEAGISRRRPWENLSLTALFAFGTVYFSTAVQGSVWFSAQVVASLLLILFLDFAIGARRPWLAGIALGCCFLTRPTTALFAAFFFFECLRASRPDSSRLALDDAGSGHRLALWLSDVAWRDVLARCARFAAPILVVGGIAMWLNHARFADPFEFGHSFLVIRWRPRIEKWGLFNYHYLAKNLSVFLAGLPWLSATYPYLKISRHGLAIWVTSPNLLLALWPRSVSPLMRSLYLATGLVALLDLTYQNSGWVQFGYRFALDYMPALIVLVALSQRRFRTGFFIALAFAIIVNLFGAITFDRVPVFYDDDATQERLFQPD